MSLQLPPLSISGLVKNEATNDQNWVRFSLPLPEATGLDIEHLRLISPTGQVHALQTNSLSDWADGSPRWLNCQAIVSERGEYQLKEVEGSNVCDIANLVEIKDGGDELTLSNGLVSVTLSESGESPIREIRYLDEVVSHEGGAVEIAAENQSGAHHSSRQDPKRKLKVLSAGPLKSVVEVSAEVETSLSYRLRIEVTANQPVITMRYWMFNLVKGDDYGHYNQVKFSTLWNKDPQTRRYLQQKRYRLLSVQREVETDYPVDIRTGTTHMKVHVHNFECLKDDTHYPEFANPPMDDTEPYVGISLQKGKSVAMWVDNFQHLNPKSLTSDNHDLTLNVWPSWAEPMQMHQGWSREMTMRLVFTDSHQHPGVGRIKNLCAATSDRAQVKLPHSWYAQNQCWFMEHVLPVKGEVKHRGASSYLSALVGLPSGTGMWDFGDTIDPGYTTTYAMVDRVKRLPGYPPIRFFTAATPSLMRYNMETCDPVWANNEYDLLACMARESMRGGNTPAHYERLAWFSRHAIEVDFIHYSDHKQMHHGSPAHSVRHCTASAYPSHLWCEGLLAYYCLTGDEDALEVAVKQGDFIIKMFTEPDTRGKLWKFTRELGWALLYIASVADITREERFYKMGHEIAEMLISKELDDDLLLGMIQTSFAYSSMALGMEMMHHATGEKIYRDWLIKVADEVMRVADDNEINISGMSMNYTNAAYALTGDEKYVHCSGDLQSILDESKTTYEWPHTKQVAMRYRPYCRFVKSAKEILDRTS